MNDIFLRRCQSVGSICKRNQKDDNCTNLSICRLLLLNSSSSWDFCWMQSTHIENGSGGIFYLVPLSFIWSNFHFPLSGPTFTFFYRVPLSLSFILSLFHFFGPIFTCFYLVSLSISFIHFHFCIYYFVSLFPLSLSIGTASVAPNSLFQLFYFLPYLLLFTT